MKPGLLVKPKWGDVNMYGSINTHHRSFLGNFEENTLGVVIDSGFSPTDVYYYQVLVDGKVGWIRAEWVEVV